MNREKRNNAVTVAVIGSLIVLFILVVGTIWMGHSARKNTAEAVRTVSLLYLDELAGRREQVVENNLNNKIKDIETAVDLMTSVDLSDKAHMEDYQKRMKRLYTLQKFAFVDENGLIYTSVGTQDNIDEYKIDYKAISEPEISIFNLHTEDKMAVIAVPVNKRFNGKVLKVCFMEIDMKDLLAGASMDTGAGGSTFCNIYTRDGIALSNTVLGGLAAEDNLIDAMRLAEFDGDESYENFLEEFRGGVRGDTSFSYNGIPETLSYVPVGGTDWMLTYLIRESVISDRLSDVSNKTINMSVLQSLATVIILLAVFAFLISQIRRNANLMLEQETANAELRGKQEELENSIALQKKLEEQSKVLSEALDAAEQANRAKTAFLSSMSHEIRTPMNAIIGLDNIALNDPDVPAQTRSYLEKIGASAEHLLSLINDILDMSRIESGRMILKNEEFSFQKLLEAINVMFSGQAAEKGIEYHCRINSEIDDYYIGDNMKLRQVLINILGNAVKFTPKGGNIELNVARIARNSGMSTLQFKISDTGIGIAKEFIPRLFDPFSQEDASTTSKYGSSGLGLAITRNIVEMMNGRIDVESEKGKGSVFTVTVTLADSKHIADGAAQDIYPSDMTVLIVDDDPIACEHARLVLEKVGISAETAPSGAEAVEMVRVRHARREPYNLILVDWQMPEMDGVETTRRMRTIIGDETAIIILTAYRWDDVLDEALGAGVDSFLAKPLFANTVIEEFRSALNLKRIRNAGRKKDIEGCRVLVAEDVDINAEIVQMMLSMKNVESDRAENGKAAVEKFASSTYGYYDAILMDIRMPEMDGLEATQH
ncbi:MAG: response regulator, partial [Firmicutes bacterium]|nr:response regulator [Bacillota bacterium]